MPPTLRPRLTMSTSGDAKSRIARRTTGVRFCTDANLAECHTAVMAFRKKERSRWRSGEVRDPTGESPAH